MSNLILYEIILFSCLGLVLGSLFGLLIQSGVAILVSGICLLVIIYGYVKAKREYFWECKE